MVTVSVPGKVHLMGEHAVVYGKPALLAAIDMRMRVSISEPSLIGKKNSDITIQSSESIEHARYAVLYVMKQLNIVHTKPVTLTIDSDIPAGFHLGSSAALAVGISAALMYFYKKIWNPIRINELAYEIEKKQHGNPSGGDNTAVTMGGFIWYRRELEFLKSIWQLPFRPPAQLNHFFLINTGRPLESTGDMVAFVRKQYEKNPLEMDRLLNENESQVKRITIALKEGQEKELIDALRMGEKTLEGFGVVSKTVIPLIRKIEALGAAAKILGGGGREKGVGFLLCYHSDKQAIEKICKQYNYSIGAVRLGEEGIRLDEK